MKKHWTILMLPALLLTRAACGVERPTLEDVILFQAKKEGQA